MQVTDNSLVEASFCNNNDVRISWLGLSSVTCVSDIPNLWLGFVDVAGANY
jgi:hypothetical protein